MGLILRTLFSLFSGLRGEVYESSTDPLSVEVYKGVHK
jgi:hypothetical protein